jgi:hypothetical protein
MREINNIFTGFKNLILNTKVPGEKRRLKICSRCPSRKKFTCGECGCILAAKVKAPNSKCPLNKW